MPARMEDRGPSPAPLDPLLRPLVEAASEEERRELQAEIVSLVQPIIRTIVRRRLRGFAQGGGQDADDIEADVLVSLLGRIEDVGAHVDAAAIANLRGYVAVMAYHACDQHVRHRHPGRWRLKSRLRYALTHCEGLALWDGASGQWMAGLEAWRGRSPVLVSSERLSRLKADARAAETPDFSGRGLPHQLRALFLWLGHPLELDDLLEVAQRLFGAADAAPAAAEVVSADVERAPEPGMGPEAALERRLYLERLWAEIRALPPRQRVALLLNLRDADGGDILGLLTLVGITCLHGIAETLEVPVRELAGLWAELPLEDAVLARRLGITRQQVINLRKSARERLSRRMRAAGLDAW